MAASGTAETDFGFFFDLRKKIVAEAESFVEFRDACHLSFRPII
jgi:hypothetical protein